MGNSKNNLPYPTCDKTGCNEMTPDDMIAICFDRSDFYCSPECARSALDDERDIPETIELVDPQYRVDRAAFPGVPDGAISILTEIKNQAGAIEVIDTFERQCPHEFRQVKMN